MSTDLLPPLPEYIEEIAGPRPTTAMSDRCHWTLEDEVAYLIPGCMGGAVVVPKGCTCGYPLSEIEWERKARREAEKCVEGLRLKAQRRQEFIDTTVRENKRLRAALQRFRAEQYEH